MSNIDKKEIEHIAELARIKLSGEEKEKMANELGAILSYIDKLNEVNTEGVEAIAYITGMENVLRKDLPSTTLGHPQVVLGEKKPSHDNGTVDAARLVEMVPESKDNFVKVPAVFGE